jgi:hypothetical protein
MPFDGDVTLLSDLLCAKPHPPPETGWSYEVATVQAARGFFKYHYVNVPSGKYSSQQELGNALADAVTPPLATDHNISVPKLFDYHYDAETKTGQYSILHDKLSVFLVLEQSVLAVALGLTYRQVLPQIVTGSDTDGKRDIVSFDLPEYRTVYFLTGNAGTSILRKPIYMHDASIDSIYVYSDIVEPQLVGDAVAPLLGIVPIKAIRGSRQFFTFKVPMYLPISTQNFSSIHVSLRTTRGKPIPFPENSPNVVCVLHFRRYNPYI